MINNFSQRHKHPLVPVA